MSTVEVELPTTVTIIEKEGQHTSIERRVRYLWQGGLNSAPLNLAGYLASIALAVGGKSDIEIHVECENGSKVLTCMKGVITDKYMCGCRAEIKVTMRSRGRRIGISKIVGRDAIEPVTDYGEIAKRLGLTDIELIEYDVMVSDLRSGRIYRNVFICRYKAKSQRAGDLIGIMLRKIVNVISEHLVQDLAHLATSFSMPAFGVKSLVKNGIQWPCLYELEVANVASTENMDVTLTLYSSSRSMFSVDVSYRFGKYIFNVYSRID